jgi:S-methylmethionine-dependent homocysteine/selenocysteine methylase
MTRYRKHLPQLDGSLFVTDGGIETTLIFHEGVDLPYFAAFDLLRDRAGKEILRDYYRRYLEIAKTNRAGFILESATWRASQDWGWKLGYSGDALAEANRKSIDLLAELREEYARDGLPIVISGCVGPRGDGYDPGTVMSANEAETYHSDQVRIFAAAQADMVTGITMTNINEAIGLTRAAAAAGMPVAISFTVETDGRLPAGDTLQAAIETVDAETGSGPVYYMINCAHPTHFETVLSRNEDWVQRIHGLRANASRLSHAELDEAKELDDGNPAELGEQYGHLRTILPNLNVVGGCCGTDHRHVGAICETLLAA